MRVQLLHKFARYVHVWWENLIRIKYFYWFRSVPQSRNISYVHVQWCTVIFISSLVSRLHSAILSIPFSEIWEIRKWQCNSSSNISFAYYLYLILEDRHWTCPVLIQPVNLQWCCLVYYWCVYVGSYFSEIVWIILSICVLC